MISASRAFRTTWKLKCQGDGEVAGSLLVLLRRSEVTMIKSAIRDEVPCQRVASSITSKKTTTLPFASEIEYFWITYRPQELLTVYLVIVLHLKIDMASEVVITVMTNTRAIIIIVFEDSLAPLWHHSEHDSGLTCELLVKFLDNIVVSVRHFSLPIPSEDLVLQ